MTTNNNKANKDNQANAVDTKANEAKANEGEARDYKAFIQSVAKDGKAPSYVTPRDLAMWFDRDERRIRTWLRAPGRSIYATVQKDGTKAHRFATTDPATKGMFDAMTRAFANGEGSNRKDARSYTDIDWSSM